MCETIPIPHSEIRAWMKAHPKEEFPVCGKPATWVRETKRGREFEFICDDCRAKNDADYRRCMEEDDECDPPDRIFPISEEVRGLTFGR